MNQLPENKIIQGDSLAVLRDLPAESVQCCVTSPPYWGLRDYDVPPLVWGGDPDCRHLWGDSTKTKSGSGSLKGSTLDGTGPGLERRAEGVGQFCLHCGAWRGCLGLEPTIDLYVEHIVMICREIRRVLKKDAVFWLNLGDSFASGKGTCFNPGG